MLPRFRCGLWSAETKVGPFGGACASYALARYERFHLLAGVVYTRRSIVARCVARGSKKMALQRVICLTAHGACATVNFWEPFSSHWGENNDSAAGTVRFLRRAVQYSDRANRVGGSRRPHHVAVFFPLLLGADFPEDAPVFPLGPANQHLPASFSRSARASRAEGSGLSGLASGSRVRSGISGTGQP